MGAQDTSPIIVGRDPDLERLAAALSDAAAGHPRIVLVGGEAGVGKTRLVREATERARAAGSRILFGSCLDIGDGGLPYLPMAEALRGLARMVPPDELRRLLGPARDDLAAIVPELGWDERADREPDELPDRSEPSGADRARMFERWIGFLGRLGTDAPVVAVVDDVQWIDRASRDLITFLVRNLTEERVAAILTYRADELPSGHPTAAWLAELSRAPGGSRFDLGRLDRAAVRLQLESIAGNKLPGDLVGRIWHRSEGNPLFVEELLAQAERGAESARPPSLVDILLARTANLERATRDVLAAVAVATRPVDERLLAAVLERTESDLEESLREAIASGILIGDPVDGRYRFKHELLREVVERRLLAGQRRSLHERYAQLLAEGTDLADASRATAAAELAHHWDAAERPAEAFHAAIAAARAAEGVHATSEVHRHYQRALELEPTLPASAHPTPADQLDLRWRAADAADLDGDFEGATILFRKARELVDVDADPTTAGLIHSRLGYLRWVTGDSASALDEHREAVRLVPEAPPSAPRARVLGGLGGALMGAGRWAESKAACEEAIACAIAAGARVDESRARNMLGSDLVFLGEIEAGLEQLRQARSIAAQTGPPEMLIVGHFNLALNLLAADHLDEALAEAMDGREATRESGLERRYGMDTAALVGDVLLRLGRWDEADEITREGLALDQQELGTIYLGAVRSRLMALRGDAAPAHRRLELIDRSSLDPDVAAFVAAVRAETALVAGRPRDASAAVEEGLASLDGMEERLWAGPLVGLGAMALAERAEAARAARDDDERAAVPAIAGALQERADRLAEGAATGSARAWVGLARAELGRADPPTDAVAWQAVIEAWDAVPDPFQGAYARYRAAEAALRAEGLRANVTGLLREARATAAALGARPLLAQIETLAGRARIDVAAVPEHAPDLTPQPESGVAVGPGRATRQARPHGLSERELEVLTLVAAGRTNGEIAEQLFITRKTAAVHVTHILDKLGVSNRVEAAMIAARLGLAEAPAEEA
jgi:DNA-binding CsgD family transcriptional regulator/tetratricopeptide (TPR) repeat protein